MVQPSGFVEIQKGLTEVLPQPLNAFRRQGDEAFIAARHHHGKAIVITIRKSTGHRDSVPWSAHDDQGKPALYRLPDKWGLARVSDFDG